MHISKEFLVEQLKTAPNGHYLDEDGNTLSFSNHAPLDLSYTDLSGIEIRDPWLVNADFSYCKLVGTQFMDESYLQESKFIGADLTGARLRDAWLQGADMTNANLSHCDLREAQMDESTLVGTIFTNANLLNTSLFDVDLTKAILDKTGLNEATLGNTKIAYSAIQNMSDHSQLFGSHITILFTDQRQLHFDTSAEFRAWLSELKT